MPYCMCIAQEMGFSIGRKGRGRWVNSPAGDDFFQQKRAQRWQLLHQSTWEWYTTHFPCPTLSADTAATMCSAQHPCCTHGGFNSLACWGTALVETGQNISHLVSTSGAETTLPFWSIWSQTHELFACLIFNQYEEQCLSHTVEHRLCIHVHTNL